ncbi:glycoside hydrolase family 20 protein [Sphingobacterium hungaricum]|uniref:beta-N-acetylhexosaminidase n=1 Tax=Sphingobacterium hungaricum TaxID=2082723 RepID=A0A928UUJ8_9SPHI|nr:family 20 glycosylhydrolase [Sphingobacterium hungaricum]MBE8713611.1 beta-N-acetylhexosaminidase [Sphingobacterium hungaricum]
MKLFRSLLSLVLIFLIGNQSIAQDLEINLIPRPNKFSQQIGQYTLPSNVEVFVSEEFSSLAELLYEYPSINSLKVEVVKKLKKSQHYGIRILKAEESDKVAKNGYKLSVDDKGIVLIAHEDKVMINALYTFIQLGYLSENPNVIPGILIEDAPRFGYRGLHLDVSRHFMPFPFLKKYIDLMAIYKLNTFHWHLTDGAGWRLEIKKYPELTNKAAWRSHTNWLDWKNNGEQYVEPGSPNASGGFYTQEQARELVSYAVRKGITIIPEIEMPGHSEEVLAVYPELSCTGVPYTQDEFCIGNEKTFEFLKNVLDEVLEIFPSTYIHIGGDEADKSHWKSCPKCQALKEKEGFKTEDELQSYAIKQMDEYLQSKGRKLIGWDEILQGGLTKGATVMSWQGEDGGIKAANMGHDVIMTPGSHLYFDYYQTDPRTQPQAMSGFVTLDKVYSYNPIPKEINAEKAKHVLGAQANVWTEYMPTYQHVEYMVFPRALALAEVVWTNQELRNWRDFQTRLQQHYKILQKLDVNYYRPSFHVKSKVDFNPAKKTNSINLTSEQLNPVIRYSTDGTNPTKNSTLYTLPIELSSSKIVKAASFLDSARVSPVEEIEIDIHKGIGKTVHYSSKWEKYPAKEELTLTNGVKGTLSYQDGEWQGFTSTFDVMLDFERREEIKSISMNFMQVPGPGVFFPGEFTVYLSDNGKNFREIQTIKNYDNTTDPQLKFKKFEVVLEKPQMARYVKVVATNPMKGFMFTDELVIY